MIKDLSNVRFANNIRTLRETHGLTQFEMAQLISERSNRKLPLTESAISAWETGRKLPSQPLLQVLSQLFEISIDDLLGIEKKEEAEKEKNKTILVDPKKFKIMDRHPVFVEFPDKSHLNQWGLMDYANQRIVFLQFYLALSNNPKYKVYTKEPDYYIMKDTIHKQPLTLTMVMDCTKPIWIEMKSMDYSVRSLYNGVYRHNEDKSALKSADGRILPYDGINVYYYAYQDKI